MFSNKEVISWKMFLFSMDTIVKTCFKSYKILKEKSSEYIYYYLYY